jgi:ribosomal protein L24
MRKRGDRVGITSGKYKGHQGAIEGKVHQRTVDYPDRYADGFQVMLDSGVVVVVRAEQVV